MLRSWTIGDVRVTSLVEYFGPTHDPAVLFPDFDRAAFDAAARRLPAGHYYPSVDRLVVAIQLWLVEAGAARIVVDTGVGNGKDRAEVPRMHRLNTLVPQWLAAAGLAPDTVTDVVLTHLHADHVGWNTVLDGARWVPAFPNARYHLPRADYAFFEAERRAGRPTDGGAFPDSVAPVVDAGLARFLGESGEVAGCLEIVPAPGHTPGQLTYWIRSRGETGVLAADVMHSALQVLLPAWSTAFCVLPDAARATRARFLAAAADAGALVMPCHFAPPHCGYVRRQGDGFVFEPASVD